MAFDPGTVIAGKYRVERVLGEGGMGVVLAARHLGLDEMVAVKLIKGERAATTDALARFQREARAAARIKSEHVARVLDVDRLPEGDPYIVMELIDGVDLHALVNRRRRIPPDEAASYIVQACEGLAEAHALGMVHRDLKLKNLFLTQRRDGRALIKVIDFGVVKLSPLAEDDDPTQGPGSAMGHVRARDATLTSAAMLIGSVHYMAPEQIRASNVVDARADVWSLGVCLYVMLAGQLPFDGHTVAEVCAQIQGRPPIDVRQHAPHVTPELAAVVTRALEKNVHRRFASVADLAKALSPFHADSAAQSRIETILESGVQSRDRGASAASSTPATSRFTEAHTQTQDMTPQPMSPVLARVESTIDAAAVGSLATHPAGVPKRSPLFVGAAITVLAAGITVAVWTGRGSRQPQLAPAAEPPPPAMTTATLAMPIAEPAPTTPPVVVTPAPAPSALPAARPAPGPAPKKTTKKTTHEPAAAAPAPAPKTEPKAEPKGAYDQF
ncbi:MAG: serine/threonine-protein kinase [Labilithrix sp.]